MKNKILIFGLLVGGLSLMAFKILNADSFIDDDHLRTIEYDQTYDLSINRLNDYNYSPVELVYKVESRFIATISKSDLDQAKTIVDILPQKATEFIDSFYSSRVSILDNHVETDKRAYAKNEVLTSDQIELIQSTDDSGNIYIRSDYKLKGTDVKLRSDYLTYFISIVPDQQAVYQNGHDSLINYLKKNSENQVEIIQNDKLRAGQVRFRISKQGLVSDVELTSTSGYDSIDLKLVEMIENIPGKWTPASNENGEKVDQELVFFFGLMGC